MYSYNEKVDIREILRITYEYPLIKCNTHEFNTALPGSAPKSSDWDTAFFWRFINGSAVQCKVCTVYTHVDVKIKYFCFIHTICYKYHTFVCISAEFTNHYKPIYLNFISTEISIFAFIFDEGLQIPAHNKLIIAVNFQELDINL